MTPRPQVAVGAIVRRADELLLIRRGRAPGAGRWSIPGGRIEPGERLSDAVERELLEETGLTATCGALVGHAERIDDAHHYVILDFAVSLTGDSTAIAGSDAADARWVALGDVAGLALVEGLAEFLFEHGVLPHTG